MPQNPGKNLGARHRISAIKTDNLKPAVPQNPGKNVGARRRISLIKTDHLKPAVPLHALPIILSLNLPQ
ncbi:hypothetical protein [Microseira wollei]|uniref:hypothetical protein n=1 Tax=Microseira wollei TaxID=467598 RepID=UPI001CFD2FE2|nr:hypothetical protein [Microseira wollei]